MAIPYSQIPAKATKQPSAFEISIPEADLSDFKALLKLSKVAAPTYESLQEDGRFGISHKWITDAKKYWEEGFDWYASREWFESANETLIPYRYWPRFVLGQSDLGFPIRASWWFGGGSLFRTPAFLKPKRGALLSPLLTLCKQEKA